MSSSSAEHLPRTAAAPGLAASPDLAQAGRINTLIQNRVALCMEGEERWALAIDALVAHDLHDVAVLAQIEEPQGVVDMLVSWMVREKKITETMSKAWKIRCKNFIALFASATSPAPSPSPSPSPSRAPSQGVKHPLGDESTCTTPESKKPRVARLPAKDLGRLNAAHPHSWRYLYFVAKLTVPANPSDPKFVCLCGTAIDPKQAANYIRHLKEVCCKKEAKRGDVKPVSIVPIVLEEADEEQQPSRPPTPEETAALHSLPDEAFSKIPAKWRAVIPPRESLATAPAAAAGGQQQLPTPPQPLQQQQQQQQPQVLSQPPQPYLHVEQPNQGLGVPDELPGLAAEHEQAHSAPDLAAAVAEALSIGDLQSAGQLIQCAQFGHRINQQAVFPVEPTQPGDP
jgi:hypothetical protein